MYYGAKYLCPESREERNKKCRANQKKYRERLRETQGLPSSTKRKRGSKTVVISDPSEDSGDDPGTPIKKQPRHPLERRSSSASGAAPKTSKQSKSSPIPPKTTKQPSKSRPAPPKNINFRDTPFNKLPKVLRMQLNALRKAGTGMSFVNIMNVCVYV